MDIKFHADWRFAAGYEFSNYDVKAIMTIEPFNTTELKPICLPLDAADTYAGYLKNG